MVLLVEWLGCQFVEEFKMVLGSEGQPFGVVLLEEQIGFSVIWLDAGEVFDRKEQLAFPLACCQHAHNYNAMGCCQVQEIQQMQQSPELAILTSFLRQLPKLTANPLDHYDMRSVLMSLDSSSIDTIKQEFQANDQAITLKKFIWLLLHSLSPSLKDQMPRTTLYYQLTKLFEDIDVDGSNSIEWSQFLEYLSSSSMSETTNIEANRVNTERRVLYWAFEEKSKYRKYPVRKIVQVVKYATLAVVNYDHLLQFVNYDKRQSKKDEKEERGKGQFRLQNIDQKKILSIDYSESDRLFGIILSNRNVCFVEDGQIQKTLGVLRPIGTQNQIKYLPLHSLWALTSHNSTLQLFPSPKTATIPNKIIFKPHEQSLTAICQISTPKAIATASLDGCIKLWHPKARRLIIELSVWKELGIEDEEQKGIKGMTVYNDGNMSWLCAWMFTSQLYLWLPSLSLSKPFSGQLRGHLGLVLDCVFSWTGQVVSLDDKRSLRIWNPNNLQCLQILTVEQDALKLSVLKSRPYIVVYSKALTFYRMKTDSKADLEHQISMANKGDRNVLARGQVSQSRLVGTMFSPYYCAIIVATSAAVKILQTNQSKLLASVSPLRQDEEYSMLAAKGQRRFYLATTKNRVYQYRVEDGAMVNARSVGTASSQLKFVYFHQSSKILLTVLETASSSYIYTYDEQAQEDCPIKEIQFEQTGLLFFTFSSKHHKFYITSDNCITIWNYHRLIITHKIDLGFLQGQDVLYMAAEESSGSILVVTEKEVYVIRMDECYDLWEASQYELSSDSDTVGAAILKKDVQINYLEQIQTRRRACQRTKAKLTEQELKGVSVKMPKNGRPGNNQAQMSSTIFHTTYQSNFHQTTAQRTFHQMRQPQDEIEQVVLDSTSPTFILALLSSKGEVSFYSMTNQFTPGQFEEPPSKGKLHRIKEKRKSFVNKSIQVDVVDFPKINDFLFTEEGSFVHRAISLGSINDNFYTFNEHQTMHVFDIYGCFLGEWNINLNVPKRWEVCFNEIDLIMDRLKLTQNALRDIVDIDGTEFKTTLLMSKYLREEDKKQLKKFQDRHYVGYPSKHALGSRFSIKATKKNIEPSMNKIIIKEDSLQPSPSDYREQPNNNPFVDKFNHYKQRKFKTGKNYQELQQFVRMRKANVSKDKDKEQALSAEKQEKQPEKQTLFADKLEKIFPTHSRFMNDNLTENSELKSKKRLLNRQSLLVERPKTSLAASPAKPSISPFKPRIKSSMTDLTKNCSHQKIQYKKFLQRNAQILANTHTLLNKKTKLKL